MATRMQQRRGTAAQWISTNSGQGPVLNAGEIGFELDTNKFKIGDGINHWVDLPYFTNNQALTDLIGDAPELLNTLGELANALGDDPAFITSVATNLSNHESDTTNIHGILDTNELATKTYVTDAIGNATVDQSALAGDGINWNTGTEQFDVDSTVVRSSDLSELAQDAVDLALTAGNGISKVYDDVNNTITVSVDTTVIQPRVANITNDEIGYLDGVTSSIQTQINSKAPTNSPTFTGTVSGITKSMVGLSQVDNTSDANKQISDATQNALDLKANLDSPTFSGTVSGITKAMVGLEYAQNTLDLDKPISTLTQAALDLKAPLASPTFTGTVTAPDLTVTSDLVVDGNLTVSGTTTTVNTANFTTADALIYLGEGNSENLIDLGIVSSFDDGTYQHSGIVRDASAGKWKLFKGVTDEPTTTVNFAQGSLDNLAVAGLEASSLTVGDVSNTEIGYLNGLSGPIQTQLDAKVNATLASSTYAPINSPTFTGTVSGITKGMIGLGNVDNITDANKPVSTATQSALDLKAPIDSPTFTGTVTLPTGTVTSGMILDGTIVDADINSSAAIAWTKIAPSSTVSATELGYLDGVTSAIQTQLDSKISSTDAASTYQTKIIGVSDAEISYLDGVTSGIQGQINLKAPIADPTFTGTVSGITKNMVGLGNVDNTSDANKPVSTATQSALDLKAPLASPTFTGTVSGITKSMVGLGSVDNTSDANKPVSTATQTALDLKADLASPTFTGTVTLPTGTVTSGMILDGTIVNADINASAAIALSKLATDPLARANHTGTQTASTISDFNEAAQDAVGGILGSGLTYTDASNTITVDNSVVQLRVTNVSDTEIGYLDGVTSAIQTQLDTKAPKAAPTFTGTLTAADVTISGNLTVSGTTTTVNTTNFTTSDPVIYLGEGNNANLVDIGFVGSYNDGTYAHQGLVKDSSDSKWKLFKGVTDEPTTTVNFAQGSLDALAVGAFEASSATIGNVSNTELQYLDGVTSAIQTQINAKAPTASPTFTGTVTIPSGAALGTPASATLTNATGLPVSTGISGLGTGIATALAVAVGSAGAPVTNGGALGTPSSGTLTNATGLPISTGVSGLGTGAATFLATPSSANFASMITDEIGTGNVVLSDIATSAQTASYTLVLSDKSKLVEMNVATANTLTVPPNSSVAFPVGSKIDILQVGAGQVTVTAGAGVTVNGTPGLKTRAQWSSASLIKRATDTWVLVGDISA